MKPRRALAALLLLALGGVLPASCAAVLGADEENTDAVAKICQCTNLTASDGVIKNLYPGGVSSCTTTLTDRLERATETTRAEWLLRYTQECRKCDDVWKCFETLPTCSDSCDSDLQCCSRNGIKAKCDVTKRTCQ